MPREFGFQFLQFLSMPRHRQESYLSTASAIHECFGCEMREGYYESEPGLRLLLVVGADSLLALRFGMSADSEEPLHRLWSILYLLNEFPPDATIDGFATPWPEDGQIYTWEAGVWREIQGLAAIVLAKNGLPLSEPEMPLEALLRQVCFVVTRKQHVGVSAPSAQSEK
jgi:hypothetical protein